MQIAPPVEGQRYGSPLFSPDGAYIYYLKAPPNSYRASLHRMAKLGGDERKVAEDIGEGDVRNDLGLSPDGRRLAFVRLDSGLNRSLVTTDLAGGDERTLAAPKLPEYVTGATWSPDGQTVATLAGGFGARKKSPGPSEVVVVRLSDGAQSEFAPEGWMKLVGLACLSDSKGLVVSASENRRVSQLWHLSYPEGVARRVTNDLSDYDSVSLTADSSRLAAVQVNTRMNIWTAPLDGSGDARQITTGVGRYDGQFGVSWMPDGRIVYHSLAGGSSDTDYTGRVGQKQIPQRLNTFPAVRPRATLLFTWRRRASSPPSGAWIRTARTHGGSRIGRPPLLLAGHPGGVLLLDTVPLAPVEGGREAHCRASEVSRSRPSSRPTEVCRQLRRLRPGGSSDRRRSLRCGDRSSLRLSPRDASLRWTPDGPALLTPSSRGVSHRVCPRRGAPRRSLLKSDIISFFDLRPMANGYQGPGRRKRVVLLHLK